MYTMIDIGYIFFCSFLRKEIFNLVDNLKTVDHIILCLMILRIKTFEKRCRIRRKCWQYLYCFSPFPNKPWFLGVCRTSLLKTLLEKEKLLVKSNFSFSHCVFYHLGALSFIFIKFEIVVCKLFQFGRVKNKFFGKGLKTVLSFGACFIYHLQKLIQILSVWTSNLLSHKERPVILFQTTNSRSVQLETTN